MNEFIVQFPEVWLSDDPWMTTDINKLNKIQISYYKSVNEIRRNDMSLISVEDFKKLIDRK